MKLLNTTAINDNLLHQIIRYCQPKGVYLKDIRKFAFKNSKRGYSGYYYNSKCISIMVPKPTKYQRPNVRVQRQGYLASTHYTWIDELIYIIAHEMRHMWQHNNAWKTPREIKRIRHYQMGTNAKLIEVDASLYGIRKMREYRKSNILFQ